LITSVKLQALAQQVLPVILGEPNFLVTRGLSAPLRERCTLSLCSRELSKGTRPRDYKRARLD
jgi:hypothetical protein